MPVATLCHGLAHALNGREDFFFLLQAAVRSGGGAGDEDLAALRPGTGGSGEPDDARTHTQSHKHTRTHFLSRALPHWLQLAGWMTIHRFT